MKRFSVLYLAAAFLFAATASAAELVRIVRMKISAGDIVSAVAAAEDHRATTGEDAEYLDALGWIARGAVMLDRPDLARTTVSKLRSRIRDEAPETLSALGAAIESESKLRLAESGRGAAIRFLESEMLQVKDIALRSRLKKNVNMLSLEGQLAPNIESVSPKLSLREFRGEPVLLFFFAEWCGDCKAQAASLSRIWRRYEPMGLRMIAVTRLYGGSKEKPLTAEDERLQVAKVWKESYPDLARVPVVIDTDAMVQYGASATPTFVLVDRVGKVHSYLPTRLTEEGISVRVEQMLEP